MKKKLIRTLILAALCTILLRWLFIRLRDSNQMTMWQPMMPVDNGITITTVGDTTAGHLDNDMKLAFKGPENARQKAVVDEFLHAWSNYQQFAWGHDELKPVSRGWIDYMGVGLTIVDSLDTMYIMGLNSEFQVARDWVAMNMTFTRDADVSVFEITIRVLGGLLSAFHLSHDQIFLDKALVLGSTLSTCFDANHHYVACNHLNLKFQRPDFSDTSTAEAGTLQLEFRDLGRASGIEVHEKAADASAEHLHKLPKMDGLVPNYISSSTGLFRSSAIVSVGANGDSYYEYLLKQWIQTGKTRDWLRDDYLTAVEGIRKHLMQFTHPNGFAFVGYLDNIKSKLFIANMEHLACFLPGTLALGVIHGLDPTHLAMAHNLTVTCHEMYRQTATGLSPDVVAVNTDIHEGKDFYFQASKLKYMLRPETVESLYYMFCATGNEQYRTWAWAIFDAIRRHTRIPGGYASLENVESTGNDGTDDNTANPRHTDQMETFFLAETLKYLYLIFAEHPKETLSLQRFVFNTEAHPLPVYEK